MKLILIQNLSIDISRRLTPALSVAVFLVGCSIPQPFEPTRRPAPPPGSTVPSPAQSNGATTGTAGGVVVPQGTELAPATPRVHQYTLGPASAALVAQAQSQQAGGDLPMASSSIERALRIEPNNPLLWLEMSKLRQAENNYPQAESMARKALSKASGDAKVQAAAWHAIADSLKARSRNEEAREADARGDSLSTGR